MKLKVSSKPENIKESSGGGFINKSGIYDLKINHIRLNRYASGASRLVFDVKTAQGALQTLYGPFLEAKNGDINEITATLLNKIAIIAGLPDDYELNIEKVEVPAGKERTVSEEEIFTDLRDIDVKLQVQMEYSKYQDKNGENSISENKNIKSVFSLEGLSATELVSGEDAGKQLSIAEKYANNVTYRDGLTEQDVKDWIESKKKDSTSATPVAKEQRKRVFGQ